MDIKVIDPVDQVGWDELLLKSGDQSFFHSSGWARVLKDSYRYKPVYFSAFQNDRISFLLPFMEVASFLTGKRGVSLPFTDFCAPFAASKEPYDEAVQAVVEFAKPARWKYAELRGADISQPVLVPWESYFTHDIDLTRSESEMFSSLSSSNRRNINKAEKDGIRVEFDGSLDSMRHFYRLNCITRRHHGLPPQPFFFFKKVWEHVISPGNGTIAIASHEGNVMASAVFFHFGKLALYKYGASDPRGLSYKPNNAILWESMKRLRSRGMSGLNLGRTEVEHLGLLRFKRSWGAVETGLIYQRIYFGRPSPSRPQRKRTRTSKLVSFFPIFALRILGRLMYRHAG